MAEDLGNFDVAAAHYAEALRADPGYQEAQERLSGAVGAGVSSTPGEGDVMSAGSGSTDLAAYRVQVGRSAPRLPPGVLATTLMSSVMDVASHQAERATKARGNDFPRGVIAQAPHSSGPRAFILFTAVIPVVRTTVVSVGLLLVTTNLNAQTRVDFNSAFLFEDYTFDSGLDFTGVSQLSVPVTLSANGRIGVLTLLERLPKST